MFRVLLTLLLLIGIVLGALYLYQGGEIPYVGGTLDDAGTTASVKALLALHRDLSRRDISVRTRDSVVTLTGEVRTAGEKKEAAEIIRGIGAVREVDNLLAVSPELTEGKSDSELSLGRRIDDATLAGKVRASFALHRDLRRAHIAIRAHDGTVTLEGSVEDPRVVETAGRWAAAVQGVERVENLLGPADSGERLQPAARRVGRALAENENLRGYRLRSTTRKGVIVLEGEVATGAERELAELIALRAAEGVEIANEIRVRRRQP